MVKCADCGFLTLRHSRTGLPIEVDDDYRVSGRVARDIADEGVQNYPLCFVRAWNLMPELEKAAGEQFTEKVIRGGGDSVDSDDWWRWGAKVLEVITDDRGCPPEGQELGFTEWQQGFTPKEHREMVDRERLLAWQVEREKQDRQFRHQESDTNRKFRRTEMRLVVATIIAILSAAVIQALL